MFTTKENYLSGTDACYALRGLEGSPVLSCDTVILTLLFLTCQFVILFPAVSHSPLLLHVYKFLYKKDNTDEKKVVLFR